MLILPLRLFVSPPPPPADLISSWNSLPNPTVKRFQLQNSQLWIKYAGNRTWTLFWDTKTVCLDSSLDRPHSLGALDNMNGILSSDLMSFCRHFSWKCSTTKKCLATDAADFDLVMCQRILRKRHLCFKFKFVCISWNQACSFEAFSLLSSNMMFIKKKNLTSNIGVSFTFFMPSVVPASRTLLPSF